MGNDRVIYVKKENKKGIVSTKSTENSVATLRSFY